MFDHFDLKLLNAMQEDADRTAEQLAEIVALSPSAIARRLRRLREEGHIARTIALLPANIADRRLRALVNIQLHDHAPAGGLAVLFPEGGRFPFHAGALVATLAACLGALLLVPRQCDVLRVGAVLYAAAALTTSSA